MPGLIQLARWLAKHCEGEMYCGKEFKSRSHSHFGREAILKITVYDPFTIDERKWTQRKLDSLVPRFIYKVAKRTQFYLAMSSVFHNLIG